MGNCLKLSSTIENASGSSKSSLSSSIPTSRTFSTVSTFSTPSYKDTRNLDVPSTPRTEGEILSSSNVKAFTYNELKITTRNFRLDGLIGAEGFGYVYKGWIDEYTLSPSKPGLGMMVAIKKLKPGCFHGPKEWLTEVEYLGQLSHPNLVKLVGYCFDDDHRLLVFEYMPKGSLENHLFRRSYEPLTWSVRMNIAVGAARGITFLHDRESPVIYRDVNASNILLDLDFNTKLCDFGLAKACPTGDNSHVFTDVLVGTFGYIAPEYVERGHITAKADVYSFGIVLLELLSGRRAIHRNRAGSEQHLLTWAKPFLANKRKVYRIMDPRLANQYPKKAAYAISILILQCICREVKLRPKMSDVLAMLESLQNDEEMTKHTQNCNWIKHASLPKRSSSDTKSPLA